ncbi:MAG: hypothetical protein KDC80_12900 [Saprospiraceae bacterium]|nr:hypothetical protein [Saprospiraceae bacterium]
MKNTKGTLNAGLATGKECICLECFFTVKKLILIIMSLRSSYQREIDRIYREIMGGDYDIREVSKSTLSQARKKLNPWAFQRLNEVAVDSF